MIYIMGKRVWSWPRNSSPPPVPFRSRIRCFKRTCRTLLINLSDGASSLIQQNMMANALQNGILGWSARSNAPAALQSYAFNKAQQQTRIGNRTVGDLAAYWLPLMKNLFEGILYGSFV